MEQRGNAPMLPNPNFTTSNQQTIFVSEQLEAKLFEEFFVLTKNDELLSMCELRNIVCGYHRTAYFSFLWAQPVSLLFNAKKEKKWVAGG